MSSKYQKVIKPKSNKLSSSRGGKRAAKTNASKTAKRKKDVTKDWPWWIPK